MAKIGLNYGLSVDKTYPIVIADGLNVPSPWGSYLRAGSKSLIIWSLPETHSVTVPNQYRPKIRGIVEWPQSPAQADLFNLLL
ncbi:MAG: hypothetical protein ACLTZB_08315 [Streptococcus salivarius]